MDDQKRRITENNESSDEIVEVNEKLIIAAVNLQELAEIAVQAEQRLRDMIDGLDALICEVNIETGKAVFLSLRTETFLGQTLDQWYATPDFLTEITHSEHRIILENRFPGYATSEQSYEYDFRAISIDDNPIYLRNIFRSVISEALKIPILRCVIVDVTQQKNIAQALELAYERERNITQALQKSALFIPAADFLPGYKVSRAYRAASDEASIGGDFSDVFACASGNFALVLGDVMGHGLPAALFTPEIKYVLRGFVREHIHPDKIMNHMNAYLYESFSLFRDGLNHEGGDSPLCLTIAVINMSTGAGEISSAGMEAPLLVRSDGTAEEIPAGGMILGVAKISDHQQASFQLGHADSIVLTTDGVTESRKGGSFLGYSGFRELALLGRSKKNLDDMGQLIVDGSIQFGGGYLRDDACVLLARRQ